MVGGLSKCCMPYDWMRLLADGKVEATFLLSTGGSRLKMAQELVCSARKRPRGEGVKGTYLIPETQSKHWTIGWPG